MLDAFIVESSCDAAIVADHRAALECKVYSLRSYFAMPVKCHVVTSRGDKIVGDTFPLKTLHFL